MTLFKKVRISKAFFSLFMVLLTGLIFLYYFITFTSRKALYGGRILVACCFFLCVFNICSVLALTKGRMDVSGPAFVWLPYFVLTILGYLIVSNEGVSSLWIVCMLLVLSSATIGIHQYIPYKLIIAFGIFMLVGIAIQIAFPAFHAEHIAPVFTTSDLIARWGRAGRYVGFSYQLDSCAEPMLFAEGVLVCFGASDIKGKRMGKMRIIFILLLIAGVFLTGKRMHTALSMLMPAIVQYCSQKKLQKRLKNIILFCCLAGTGFALLLLNLDRIKEVINISQWIRTVEEIQSGGDISSGRIDLYIAALDAFWDHPVFGVGGGKFIEYTEAYTATHNTYLQVLCEQGLVGFVCFFPPIIYCFIVTIQELRLSKNESKMYLRFSLFCQLHYIIYGLTGNTNINYCGFMMYFIGIAILCDVMQSKKASTAQAEYLIDK